jgi:hypothetical protein
MQCLINSNPKKQEIHQYIVQHRQVLYFDYYLPVAYHIAKCSEYKLNVLMTCDLINNYSVAMFWHVIIFLFSYRAFFVLCL